MSSRLTLNPLRLLWKSPLERLDVSCMSFSFCLSCYLFSFFSFLLLQIFFISWLATRGDCVRCSRRDRWRDFWKTVQKKNDATVLILYHCSCWILVDVSYYVIWVGFKGEQGEGREGRVRFSRGHTLKQVLSSFLLWCFLQCLYCIAILVGIYLTLSGRGIGTDVKRFGRGEGGGTCNLAWGSLCKKYKKSTKKRKKRSTFYILPIYKYSGLNLVLAGLLNSSPRD